MLMPFDKIEMDYIMVLNANESISERICSRSIINICILVKDDWRVYKHTGAPGGTLPGLLHSSVPNCPTVCVQAMISVAFDFETKRLIYQFMAK